MKLDTFRGNLLAEYQIYNCRKMLKAVLADQFESSRIDVLCDMAEAFCASEIARKKSDSSVSAMHAALVECEEYFDNRADADCDLDGFIPNKEMQILSVVKEALE